MKVCRYGPRRETVAKAAKRKYPHLLLAMARAQLLFANEPHKQLAQVLTRERVPNRAAFAGLAHEALRLLASPAIGLPLKGVGGFGADHAFALAKYWVTHGFAGAALDQRMAVLRYWARWCGNPAYAPVMEDVVRELKEVCHG